MSDKDLQNKEIGVNTDAASGSDKGGVRRKYLSDNGLLRWVGFGVEFGGVVGIFSYGGWLADEKWGTGPWLLLTGFMIAFVGMFYQVVKETLNMRK